MTFKKIIVLKNGNYCCDGKFVHSFIPELLDSEGRTSESCVWGSKSNTVILNLNSSIYFVEQGSGEELWSCVVMKNCRVKCSVSFLRRQNLITNIIFVDCSSIQSKSDLHYPTSCMICQDMEFCCPISHQSHHFLISSHHPKMMWHLNI